MVESATTLGGVSAADTTRAVGLPRAASGVRRRALPPPIPEGEGPFRLVRELGRGGMGVVWLAQHRRLGIPCAVKFLGPSPCVGLTERDGLVREVTMAYRVSGPNVVRVLDHGRCGGQAYIAMELLEGEDLAKRLRRVGRLSPREGWAVARQAASALERAHAAGVVHRDLKPANIFLAREGDAEVVKVLDFGIADWQGSGGDAPAAAVTPGAVTSNLVGTPLYMSPEQAEGRRVDGRADLWSLAIIVFECLTGSRPLRGGSVGELLVKVLSEPLPSPTSRLPSLPPALDAWWARATSRDPEGRFATAGAFAAALGRALGLVPAARPAMASVTPLRLAAVPPLARAV
ncbi:MAG TPA: serine/threonine-protein kinase [Polyangiaceae bacterium]|nr:serine/threonine-protein kinase [Polyangiaceae bacterium]